MILVKSIFYAHEKGKDDKMDKIYSVWLHKLGINEYIKLKMLHDFKTFQSVYNASEKQYQKYKLSEKQLEKIYHSKNNLEEIEKLIEKCQTLGVQILDLLDEDYPSELKQIPDPPLVLFAMGNTSYLNHPSIAVVGARKCSEYGFNITKRLARELAEMGLAVTSGMATGIDEAAHKGALEQGITIAVLGTGIDICYPQSNYQIYRQIAQKGCIITEFPIGTPPLPYQFPKRNRIISGISIGVLVTEAQEKSGSLITADLGLQYNKDIYAVPGNVESRFSIGTNKLIQQGAKLIINTKDILDELPMHVRMKINNNKTKCYDKKNIELAQQESIVYDYVSRQPKYFNEIYSELELSYEMINTTLVKLELKGLIRRLPGERYVRV